MRKLYASHGCLLAAQVLNGEEDGSAGTEYERPLMGNENG